ncbi:putative FYVE zinc finger TCP 1 cpn60 chaperonin family Phosphatidylinositol 4 phosphate 5 Kinase [Trypanosoma vivax]|nr:putative FYVE zinc finger TCP 1 cpn60 chaperonin family Phosphatidylinositol 4 phosphate 5 Kinase [Trypanosoma vivax]
MYSSRALWVEDRYALRCSGCDSRFTMLWRRHHCRGCGQVFCSNCLLVPPMSISKNVVTEKLSSFIGIPREETVKICSECERIRRQREHTDGRIIRTSKELQDTNTRAGATVASQEGVKDVGGRFISERARLSSLSASHARCLSPCKNDTHEQTCVVPEGDSLLLSPRSSSGVSQVAQNMDEVMLKAPLTHPETREEREVTYGLTEVPLHSRNETSDWATRLVREACKRRKCFSSRAPRKSSRSLVFVPQPKVTFRWLPMQEEIGAPLVNEFQPCVQPDVLAHLEQESSLHLLRRASQFFAKDTTLSATHDLDRVEWIAGICDLSWRVTSQTAFVQGEHVAQHLDVIPVPGGSLGDSEVLSGVAFVQTVAFKRMRTSVREPRILLLSGDVGIGDKLPTDLTEYINGYEGYLDKQYERITVWQPTVIVVEGTMHHYLLDKILYHSQVTLILHAGNEILSRLAYCCSASIVRNLQYVSVEELRSTSAVGTCNMFQLLDVGGQHICAFTGMRAPLFTTIILRGAEQEQLESIKRILVSCTTAAYHLALQAHCIADLGMRWDPSPRTSEHFQQMPWKGDSGAAGNKQDSENDKSRDASPLIRFSGPCKEYFDFIASSTRVSHRAEDLSMNIGIRFPVEVTAGSDKCDDLTRDSMVLNVVTLGHTADGSAGEEASHSASVSSIGKQTRSVCTFYGEGDETLLDCLTRCAADCENSYLILHNTKRIWLKTKPGALYSADTGCPSRPQQQCRSAIGPCGEAGGPRQLFLRSHATCRNCSGKKSHSGATLSPCSIHLTNLSWGAFLEFLTYTSPRIKMSCGHNPFQSVCLSFVLGYNTASETVVSINVEEARYYSVIPPLMTMRSGGDVARLYLNDEVEQLHQCVTQVTAAISAIMDTVSGQSHQTASQARNVKNALSSLLSSTNTPDMESVCVNEELGRALLRRAEEIIASLSSLSSTGTSIEEIRNDFMEFLESYQVWCNGAASSSERRSGSMGGNVGGKSFVRLDVGKLQCSLWAQDVSGGCTVRLNEPTSLIAGALQASNTWLEGASRSIAGLPDICGQAHAAVEVSKDFLQLVESQVLADGGEESLLEKSIKDLLGADSAKTSEPPHFSPSPLHSVSDAMETLSKGVSQTKTTFQHVRKVSFPWDKTDPITVTVEVMFPVQFAALHYLYTDGRVGEFLRSLSRCRALKPQGGKTQSDFYETLDGRFLLKQIKQTELVHFAQFGPKYFNQIHRAYRHARNCKSFERGPSFSCVLGKILGVFSLHIKCRKRFADNQGEVQYFVLIENIFYARQMHVVYDLKGSQRNRTAPEGSSVLLDQDLATGMRKGAFFFCSSNAKRLLMERITCDAHLLTTCAIMDYSLIVGVNHSRRELYVGIIDYLHPYTGAKAIESKVKAGLETVLGVPGRDPTIIDPVSYRVRFTRWMSECFCGVPRKIMLTNTDTEGDSQQ